MKLNSSEWGGGGMDEAWASSAGLLACFGSRSGGPTVAALPARPAEGTVNQDCRTTRRMSSLDTVADHALCCPTVLVTLHLLARVQSDCKPACAFQNQCPLLQPLMPYAAARSCRPSSTTPLPRSCGARGCCSCCGA